MDDNLTLCPEWLAKRIELEGGFVSFERFMEFSLNDPIYGAYSNKGLKIGKKGDFATSPSLGVEFAELLSLQIIDWFKQIEQTISNQDYLSLIELGPGEGILMSDLLSCFEKKCPKLIPRLKIILVDINEGMKFKQKELLESKKKDFSIEWSSLDDLTDKPLYGICIANEVLDALPVERINFYNSKMYRQGISLSKISGVNYLNFINLPLNTNLVKSIVRADKFLGEPIFKENYPDGWSTEWHINVDKLLSKISQCLTKGALLVMDYALEVKRYYNYSRSSGTLISYRNNIANSNIIKDPGLCDLTAHLCIETFIHSAKINQFNFIGETRQGQALLALGLAQKLSDIKYKYQYSLEQALLSRDNLLTLIDPLGLGEFRWFAFTKDMNYLSGLKTKFLEDPTI